MGIGADFPENWIFEKGEGPSRNLIHTERVNEEIVLDVIYISKMGLALGGKADSRGILQEVHLPTGHANFTELFQYVVGPGSGFRKMRSNAGAKKYHRSAVS